MARKQRSYDEQFKQNIVQLFNNGKSQSQLASEYGLSITTIARWIKSYSQVRLDDDSFISAKQIKELQKRNAALEEENIILKKAISIFTPHSHND